MDEGFNTSPKRNAANNSKFIVGGIAGVIIGGLGFVGGMQYEKGHVSTSSSATTTAANAQGAAGTNRGFGARGMGGFGTVSAISTTSITVKEQRAGTETTYAITSATKITNGTATGSVSDIKSGDRVIVQTSTSDTKMATSITINPTMPTDGAGGGANMGTPPTTDDTGSST